MKYVRQVNDVSLQKLFDMSEEKTAKQDQDGEESVESGSTEKPPKEPTVENQFCNLSGLQELYEDVINPETAKTPAWPYSKLRSSKTPVKSHEIQSVLDQDG